MILLLANSLAITHAAPVISFRGIANAATTFPPASLPGSGIAPGSIFVITGRGLGPATLVDGRLPLSTRLPADDSGTEVRLQPLGTGASIAAYIRSTSGSRVEAILPSSTPVGPADVVVAYQGETSTPSRINVIRSAFGIFTRPGRLPLVINYASAADQRLNQLTRPALPGQFLILWGTGLGAIGSPDNEPPPPAQVDAGVEVEIYGKRIRPAYAGRAPGFPGVDQINFQLPDDPSIPDDCYILVRIWTGERVSNSVTIAKSPTPGACRHPLGLSAETLARLDAGGRVALGVVRIFEEDGFFLATGLNAASVRLFAASASSLSVFSPWESPPGPACTESESSIVRESFPFDSPPPTPDLPPPDLPLDAGERLVLTGPNQKRLELRRSADSEVYTTLVGSDGRCCTPDLPAGYFEPGDWNVAGNGGINVGSFQATLRLPPPVRLVDPPQRIDRSRDLTLQWNTAGYSDGDRISISLSQQGPEVSGSIPVLEVRCNFAATAGRAMLPTHLLSHLLTNWPGTLQIWFVGHDVPFTAPGLEYGSSSFTHVESRSVSLE